MPTPSVLCCGVRIDLVSLERAADHLMGRPGSHAVHLCNAYTLSLARRDPNLAAALNRGDLNLPDGMSVVWAARRVGVPGSRVYGPDLMEAVLDRGRTAGLRHYLYGSTPAVVAKLTSEVARKYPGVIVAGAEPSLFRPLTDRERSDLAERVASSKADIVWLGLGTPLQDFFADANRDLVRVPLVAVGAAFDFIAGMKRQAPSWMQRRGLEWLFRLATEPRRLWRRYLIGNSVFLAGVLRGELRALERS